MLTKPPAKNNLYLSNPTLAREWHPTKNGSLTPRDVTGYANRKIWWLCSKDHVWSATINERIHGMNCPHCSGKKVEDEPVRQTFAPELAGEWHPTKNEDLKVWWICSNGHEWSATVKERNQGSDCPYCSGKIIEKETAQTLTPPEADEISPAKESRAPKAKAPADGKVSAENSLQTLNPSLAREWHPTKNGSLTPGDVTPNSGSNVWWICSKGHEWKAAVSRRSKGEGCFYCSYIQKRKHS